MTVLRENDYYEVNDKQHDDMENISYISSDGRRK